MLGLLVTLVVIALIVGLIYWAITMIPLPQPVRTVIIVILVVVVVLYLISMLAGGGLTGGGLSLHHLC